MPLAPNTLTIESDLAPTETLSDYAVRIGHVGTASRLRTLKRRFWRGDEDMAPGKVGRVRTRTTTPDWED